MPYEFVEGDPNFQTIAPIQHVPAKAAEVYMILNARDAEVDGSRVLKCKIDEGEFICKRVEINILARTTGNSVNMLLEAWKDKEPQ